MGFWSRLLGIDSYDPAQRVLPDPYEPYISTGGIPVMDPGTPLEYWRDGARSEIERFWKTQPNLRKIIDFIARNVASIPLQAFDRVSDTDRQRVTEGRLAGMLSTPRSGVGAFRFWHSVISDGLLYDRWCVLIDGDELVQVPSWRLKFHVDALRRVVGIKYWVGDAGDPDHQWEDVDLELAVFDAGYAPQSAGLSPVQTLRDILQESAEAVAYRKEIWENGARFPGYISRPKDAPWEKEQRQRFVTQMREVYGRDGAQRGGMPLLEDGMEIKEHRTFTPQDAQDLEGRRLTAIEVAAAFHIAPELVGARQGNYSNVREYRQMLYRDSLGPYIRAVEDALNAQLVPKVAPNTSHYVEANVEAKLRGDFIEQAKVKQGAVGGPWMSINEARALENRPPIEGGEVVLTPLNMLPLRGESEDEEPVEKASAVESADVVQKLINAAMALIRTGFLPDAALEAVGLDPIEHSGLLPVTLQRPDEESDTADSAASGAAKSARVRVKSRPPENHQEKFQEVLSAFFSRQGRVVRSALGVKSEAGWWDAQRWDAELAADLLRLNLMSATEVAQRTLQELGYDGSEYDQERTIAFLRSVSERVAGQVNATTLAELEAALESDDPSEAVAHVFEVAETSRAEQAAITALTFAAAFGTVEAARQVSGERATKTWVVTSSNPRPSHAAMNGQTVGINEKFSNGADWPADGNLSVDEIAGCQCAVVVNIP